MVHETNSNSLTIEETSNGYIENVKLEGRTLVNLWGNKSSDFLLSGQATFNEEAGYVEITSTSHRYSNVFTKYTENLKPSTLYTIIVDVVENTFTNIPILRVSSADSTTDNNNSCFNEPKVINGGETGRFMFKLTTISDFSNVNVGLRTFVGNDNAEIGCKLKFRILILEGDHTHNHPNYFKGLKSVGDDVDKILILTRKEDGNLFDTDINSYVQTNIIANIGSKLDLSSVNLARVTFKSNVKINPSKRYFLIPSDLYDYGVICTDDNDIVVYNSSWTNVIEFKLPQTSRKLFIYAKRKDGQNIDKQSFVCENHVFSTIKYDSYIPYKAHKKQLLYKDVDGIWKKPILCKWNTIEKHDDGKWYYHKRNEQIILDGTGKWNLLNATPNMRYWTAPKKLGKTDTQKLSNDFTNVINTTYSRGNNHIGIDTNGNIVLGLDKSKVDITYLLNNPITLVYELAQEEVYECLPISVASYNGETTYRIESGVISPSSSFELNYTLSNAVARVSDVKEFNNAMIDNLKIILNNLSSKIE